MNMKMIVDPKWRELSHHKWMSNKDFLAKITYKDKTWNQIMNQSIDHPEPFVEHKVEFRQKEN